MLVKQTTENRIGKGKAGPGRPKGVANKTTALVKDMITAALSEAGGQDYLVQQGRDNPTAFLTLVGKVIPLQVSGGLDHNVTVKGALSWKPPQ